MLSSWFGLEPIPICSIDRAPFSGPESRSGASLTDWTTGKIGIDPALGAHLRGLLAVLRRRLGGFPGLCGLLESFRRASASRMALASRSSWRPSSVWLLAKASIRLVR